MTGHDIGLSANLWLKKQIDEFPTIDKHSLILPIYIILGIVCNPPPSCRCQIFRVINSPDAFYLVSCSLLLSVACLIHIMKAGDTRLMARLLLLEASIVMASASQQSTQNGINSRPTLYTTVQAFHSFGSIPNRFL